MTGWRPASKRPRSGQRVVVISAWGSIVFAGVYTNRFADDVWEAHRTVQFRDVSKWIPESELVRKARAAGKKVK